MVKLRAKSKSKFEKNFYKLLINAIYGKFLENAAKYIETIVVRKGELLTILIASPFFITAVELSDDFVLVYMRPKQVKIIRPFIIGVIIMLEY